MTTLQDTLGEKNEEIIIDLFGVQCFCSLVPVADVEDYFVSPGFLNSSTWNTNISTGVVQYACNSIVGQKNETTSELVVSMTNKTERQLTTLPFDLRYGAEIDFLVKIGNDSPIVEKVPSDLCCKPTSEVQAVFCRATSGTFELTFRGAGPIVIPVINTTAAGIEKAFEAISTVQDVTVQYRCASFSNLLLHYSFVFLMLFFSSSFHTQDC